MRRRQDECTEQRALCRTGNGKNTGSHEATSCESGGGLSGNKRLQTPGTHAARTLLFRVPLLVSVWLVAGHIFLISELGVKHTPNACGRLDIGGRKERAGIVSDTQAPARPRAKIR
jgi:hypothetical protein